LKTTGIKLFAALYSNEKHVKVCRHTIKNSCQLASTYDQKTVSSGTKIVICQHFFIDIRRYSAKPALDIFEEM